MGASELARRAVRSSPRLRAVVKSRPAQHAIQTARAARVLAPSGTFVAGQALRRGARRYTLRPSGAVVHLRHNSRDVDILNEVFGGAGGRLAYAPPPRVAAALDAGRPLRVLDVGGNIGLFALFALDRWPIERVRSFEPDPSNAALLRATMRANDAGPRWTLEQVAVSNRAGQMRFAAGLLAEARAATAADDGIDVPMVDLLALDHDVDLLKMDIEGGEWPILTDPRFASCGARALVMEWHAQFCPEPDAHGAVLRLLAEAGYAVVEEHVEHARNGVLWALR